MGRGLDVVAPSSAGVMGVRRQTLARATAIGALALSVMLLVAGYRQYRARSVPPAGRPSDGWQATGVRLESFDAGNVAARVAADVVRMRRVRVGPFRLGFAWTLAVRNLAVDVGPKASAPRGGDHGTTRPERLRRELTSIEIDGLRLRLQRANGAVVEMTAGRAEIGWRDGERARLRDGVRVRGEGVDVVVPALDFNPSGHRFVGAGGQVDDVAVDRINAVMGQIAAPDSDALVAILRRLTASGPGGL
jgi:hypothetical protein